MTPIANDGPHPIVAALGPTNTGKTHHAVERMLEHDSGMIGLPLRLLAREIYDRVTARVGEGTVALVTGEERRVPPRPKYWICTTEAMSISRDVDFVAVDEIQLAEHPQRGHVFTDRILHARGRKETWLLGADTMRKRIRELVPTADLQARPRLSRLTSAGRINLKALPPRSAIVAFSASQVYEMAERVQHIHGGAAVVLGALSPRTRNAQVAMYQSGEVRFLVATDAIGMGLNMDVDLVAFASTRKFDGQRERMLEPAEIAQIAGRAGRYLNDGQFATLAPLPALPFPITYALENHAFPSVRQLAWRNTDLDMSTIDSLIASLKQRPPRPFLRLMDHAEDHQALLALASQQEVRKRTNTPERVALLWTVCQIPDFRQLMTDDHHRLLVELFLQLAGSQGRIDQDWMEGKITRIDDIGGDIDSLMTRISFIRTWTYVANHGQWVFDSAHWQQRTRDIEDRLSDALHERLVQRFVTQGRIRTPGSASRKGKVRARPAPEDRGAKRYDSPFKALLGMKVRGAGERIEQPVSTDAWLNEVVEAGYDAFSVDEQGRITCDGSVVGRLSKGAELIRPEALITMEDLRAGARLRLQRRLSAFVRDWVDELLSPLRKESFATLSPAGRGLLFQLEQRMGTVREQQARDQVSNLTASDRTTLRYAGVVAGNYCIFFRSMLQPAAMRRRSILCMTHLSHSKMLVSGAGSWCELVPDMDASIYTAMGYLVMGKRGVRADIVEKVAGALSRSSRAGSFIIPEVVSGWLGVGQEDDEEEAMMGAFGYERSQVVGEVRWTRSMVKTKLAKTKVANRMRKSRQKK